MPDLVLTDAEKNTLAALLAKVNQTMPDTGTAEVTIDGEAVTIAF
jgi:hypothetical protein